MAPRRPEDRSLTGRAKPESRTASRASREPSVESLEPRAERTASRANREPSDRSSVMRHRKSGRSLGRTSDHRRAMFRNMAASLIEHERITTTVPKARELRRVVEPLITLAGEDGVARRRLAFNRLRNKKAVGKLFDELGPPLQRAPRRLPQHPQERPPPRRRRPPGRSPPRARRPSRITPQPKRPPHLLPRYAKGGTPCLPVVAGPSPFPCIPLPERRHPGSVPLSLLQRSPEGECREKALSRMVYQFPGFRGRGRAGPEGCVVHLRRLAIRRR